MATLHTLILDVQNISAQPLAGALVEVSYDRQVRLVSGGVVPRLASAPIRIDGAVSPGVQVIASDDPDVTSDSQGFGVKVTVAWSDSGGGRHAEAWMAQVHTSDPATVNLSSVVGAQPITQNLATVQEIFDAAATAGIVGPQGPKGDPGPAGAATDAGMAPILQDTASASYAAAQSAAHAALDTTIAGKVAKDTVTINLSDHVAANSTTDQTAALQTFFNNVVPAGAEVLLPKGTWRVDGTVTVAASNVTVRLRQGHVWDRSHAVSGTETQSAIILSGDNCTVKGTGQILSPAYWDGTNTEWADAVIKCTGASPTVKRVQLVNVPRVGIGFKDVSGTARITDVTITGNYPSSQWTEVETMHAGIAYDPGATDARMISKGNTISSCVQGIFCGNYGLGSSVGTIISNNVLIRNWNHGLYNAGGLTSMVVSGNVFADCSRPIALTDSGHIVTGNTITASSSGSTLYWAANINIRNAIDCIISNNNIQGDLPSTAAAIDLNHVSGGTTVSGNVVTGNRIKTTTANLGYAIRVGTSASTVMARNIVQGNIIESAGTVNNGIISLACAAGASDSSGNIVQGNTVTILTNSSGIYLSNVSRTKVLSNVIRLGFDASSAAVLGGVRFAGTTGTVVRDTTVVVPATYGTNVTMRAIWEESTGNTAPFIANSTISLDMTKLASGTPFVIYNAVIDETGTAAPAFTAGQGSKWIWLGGGAGSTMYIKETASNSATWRAV